MDLIAHNFIYLNLNEPNVLQGDLSWIRPGKTFRSGLSQKEALAAVDFAAERGLQYIHLDARVVRAGNEDGERRDPYIRKQRPGHQGPSATTPPRKASAYGFTSTNVPSSNK